MKTLDNSKKKNVDEKKPESKTNVLNKELNTKDVPDEKFAGTLRHKTGEKDNK